MSYVRLAVWIDGPIKDLNDVTNYDVDSLGGDFEIVECISDSDEQEALENIEELRLALALEG